MPKELHPGYMYYYDSNNEMLLLLYKLKVHINKDKEDDKHYGRITYIFVPESKLVLRPDYKFIPNQDMELMTSDDYIIGTLEEIFPTTTTYLYQGITKLTKNKTPPPSENVDLYVFRNYIDGKYELWGLTIPKNEHLKQKLLKSIITKKEFESSSNILHGGRRTRRKRKTRSRTPEKLK
jgi:hypothetical protein